MSSTNWIVLGIVIAINIGAVILKIYLKKSMKSLYGLGEINQDGYRKGELIRGEKR